MLAPAELLSTSENPASSSFPLGTQGYEDCCPLTIWQAARDNRGFTESQGAATNAVQSTYRLQLDLMNDLRGTSNRTSQVAPHTRLCRVTHRGSARVNRVRQMWESTQLPDR